MSVATALRVGSQIGQGQFQVTRVLARGTAGLLFTARAPRDPRDWVIKEIQPATWVDDQVQRMESVPLQRVSPACATVTHEGRRFLVHEYVDGIPVETMARMGRRPLRHDQVLREALRLVEDLARMEKAGIALSDRILVPEHVVVDPDSRLRAVNPMPGADPVPPGTTAGRLSARLGDLVAMLLAPGGNTAALPPDVAWFVARCRGDGGRAAYQNLDQLLSALRELLPEEATLPQGRPPDEPKTPPPAPPRWLLRAALLALAVPSVLLGLALTPRTVPLVPRQAVVAFPDRLEVLDADSLRPLRTWRATSDLRSMVALRDGVLAAAMPGCLGFLDPGQDRVLPVPGSGTAASVARDASGRWLALPLPTQGLVKVEPVAPLLRGAMGERVFRRNSPGRVVSVSGRQVHVALGSTRPGAGFPTVFLAEPERGVVTRMELDPPVLAAECPLTRPGPMLLSRGERSLYVACPDTSQVHHLDARTLARVARASAAGGTGPLALALSPRGDEVWSANRSGTVAVLGAEDLALRAAVPLGKPIRLASAGPPGLADPRMWVVAGDELLAVDLKSRRIANRTRLWGNPVSLAVFAAGGGADLTLRAMASPSEGGLAAPTGDPASSLRTRQTVPGDGPIPPPGGSVRRPGPIPSKRGRQVETDLETR